MERVETGELLIGGLCLDCTCPGMPWPGWSVCLAMHRSMLPVACALVNALCYRFVMKDHVTQFPLQVIYFCVFHSDGEGRKRTSSTCSNESLNAGGTPVTPRRVSWRQRIFLRVASPMSKSPSAMQQGSFASHLPLTAVLDSAVEGDAFCTKRIKWLQ